LSQLGRLGFSIARILRGGRFAARPSGLAFGLALAVRPAGLAEVSGAQGWALAPIALATRPEGAPLTLEGPARTMRGVPAPEL
jgi:hypothetical protein